MRRELEAEGLIPATAERMSRTPPPRKPGRARLAIEAALTSASEVAAAAGVTYQAARIALRSSQFAPAQHEQAAAVDTLTVIRRQARITGPEPRRRAPYIPELPVAPDWDLGLCTHEGGGY